MITISEKIKELRLKNGWTQKEIAEKLSITQAGYQKLESSDSDITFSRLNQIAEIFGMSVVDIINYPNVVVSGADSERVKELEDYLFQIRSFMNETNQKELELVKLIFKYIQQQEIDIESAYQKAKEEWYEENIEKLKGIFKNIEKDNFYLKIKTMEFNEFNEKIILRLQKLIAKII